MTTTMTSPQTADEVRTDIARTRVALGDTADALLQKMNISARFRHRVAGAQNQLKSALARIPKDRAEFMDALTTARQAVTRKPRITATLLGAGAIAIALIAYTRNRSR